MKTIIILDDDSERHDALTDWVRKTFEVNFEVFNVYSINEFQQRMMMIEENHDLIILLDHDLGLGNGVGDGVMAAEYLEKNANKYGGSEVIIHTMNPVAGERMVKILNNEYTVSKVPFWHFI